MVQAPLIYWGWSCGSSSQAPIYSVAIYAWRRDSVLNNLWTACIVVRSCFLLCPGQWWRAAQTSNRKVEFSNIHWGLGACTICGGGGDSSAFSSCNLLLASPCGPIFTSLSGRDGQARKYWTLHRVVQHRICVWKRKWLNEKLLRSWMTCTRLNDGGCKLVM